MTTPAPDSRALPFDELLVHLRRQGFRIGVDHYLRLQELLDRSSREAAPQDLKTLLCPLFATSKSEQEHFYRAFDNFFELFRQAAPERAAPEADVESFAAQPPPPRPAARRKRLYLLGAAALVVAVVVAVWVWQPRQVEEQTGGAGDRAQTQNTAQPSQLPQENAPPDGTAGQPTPQQQSPAPEAGPGLGERVLTFFYSYLRPPLRVASVLVTIIAPLVIFLFYYQPPHSVRGWARSRLLRIIILWSAIITQASVSAAWVLGNNYFLYFALLPLMPLKIAFPALNLLPLITLYVLLVFLLFLFFYRQPPGGSRPLLETYKYTRVVLLCLAVLASASHFLRFTALDWKALFAPLVFFLIYEWHRYRRRKLILQKQRGRKPPYAWPVTVEAFAPKLYDSEVFQNTAREMRRRQAGEHSRLDVEATVSATIEALGYPAFRYRLYSRPPEYLVLIDRASFRDHQAQLFSELASALEREGIFVVRYFYDGDPRVCCEESGAGCLPLAELHSRYHGHRLLVFGDGEMFLDPVTGDPAPWAGLLAEWQTRALLTPRAPAQWGLREVSLAGSFLLLPATLEGLLTLVTHFESLTETDVRAWRRASSEPPPPEFFEDETSGLAAVLRGYLGEQTFQWLCAVYPELHWDLTLYLGSLPALGGNLLREENLLRLVRLPWFRHGSIPEEVRWLLIQKLDAEKEQAVRAAIVELLERNPPPAETYAADAYQLNLVVQRWLSRRDRRRRREVAEALESAPQSQVARDYTLMRFLETPPDSAVSLLLPTRLRRLFYRDGVPAFGLKTGARLLAAVAVAVTGLGVRELRSSLSAVPSEAAKPSAAEVANVGSESDRGVGGLTPVLGMAYVPGGGFTMGRDDSPDVSERPAHLVSVKPYFIDIYEVTHGDYAIFVESTARRPPPGWGSTYPTGAALNPVTGVAWDDANAYCQWNGKRLPTEEEWELAARGTDGRRYPWGDDWRDGLANANGARPGVANVGSYGGESPFGAYDMVGNAWEWTASAMSAYPGGRLPPNLPAGDLKVIRGGSYESGKDYATTTYRTGWPARGAQTYDQTGFRCVADVAPADVESAAPADLSRVRAEIRSTLAGWTSTIRRHDTEAHMKYYADTLETYYNRKNVTTDALRSERARTFDRYYDFEVKIENVKIKPDPTGTRATAVFDKTWKFTADDRVSSGSVQQQLTLVRVGLNWLITGEKELKVYYTNTEDTP